jgi:hypothetical protein
MLARAHTFTIEGLLTPGDGGRYVLHERIPGRRGAGLPGGEY